MKKKVCKSASSGSFTGFLIILVLLIGAGCVWAEEKAPVQLVSVSPMGGSYISNTPEFTLTFDKNVANALVRDHNLDQVIFLNGAGSEVLIHVDIADDEIYPLLKREIRVKVLEALSPGTYRLIIQAGVRAKNGTETAKAYTYYYRVKAEEKPEESQSLKETEKASEKEPERETEKEKESEKESSKESESRKEPEKESSKETESRKEPEKESSRESVREPATESKKEPVQESWRESVKEPEKESSKESPKETARESSKESPKETTRESTLEPKQESKKESVEKPERESGKESAKEPVNSPGKDPDQSPEKESPKETEKESRKDLLPVTEAETEEETTALERTIQTQDPSLAYIKETQPVESDEDSPSQELVLYKIKLTDQPRAGLEQPVVKKEALSAPEGGGRILTKAIDLTLSAGLILFLIGFISRLLRFRKELEREEDKNS